MERRGGHFETGFALGLRRRPRSDLSRVGRTELVRNLVAMSVDGSRRKGVPGRSVNADSGPSLDSPESAATEETSLDDVLEDALESGAQDTTEYVDYIATRMPSRQAQRIGYSYVTLRHRTLNRLKRRSSSHRKPVCRDSEASVGDRVDYAEGDASLLPMEGPRTEDEIEDDQLNEWEQLMEIRCMVAPMAKKREAWSNKKTINRKTDTGKPYWKMRVRRQFESLRVDIKSAFSNVYFWRNSIHNIEGYYGTGVAAVFVFLQWLLFLNILMLVLVTIFIVVPQALDLGHPGSNETSLIPKPYSVAMISCPPNSTLNRSEEMFGVFQDFLQGTGWMEWTEMFYGFYFYNFTDDDPTFLSSANGFNRGSSYNLPLAYLMVTVFYFALCFVLMMRSAARGSREILFTSTSTVNQFGNVIFGGWDFCIREKKTAGIRRQMICNELEALIDEDKLDREKRTRTKQMKFGLFVTRFLINALVILILATCGTLIFFVVDRSQIILGDGTPTKNNYLTLLVEFLPPLTIVVLNLIVPLVFEYLAKYERYSPPTVIHKTLIRTVFLRLSAIAVLLGTLYKGIRQSEEGCLHCWETYVGQQFYKLAIVDFVIGVIIPFLFHFPRKLLVMYVDCRVTKWIGLQPFDVPTHVLDIVYGQALCWIGTFYCPLLPVVTVVKCLVFFYVKEFSLFVTCIQSRLTYRASKSFNLFVIVLLLSFILACIPVAFSIGKLTPSKDCGPFIGLNYMWDAVSQSMNEWPTFARTVFGFFGTAGFAVPALILLLLVIYFYFTVASAHKHELSLLHDQLLLDGKDKQFLLKRLKVIIEEGKRQRLRESIRVRTYTDL